ncbi:MAG: acetolactate synthase small subunit [Deltaproteobacteria bacterium]|nr:acetolactate synthase small subunit [Deltaproteobacteria bacterium]
MNNGTENKKHILSLLVENELGVLSRISGLFSGRGFNIESLCVAETNEENISRVTLVTTGDMFILEQIKKQLNKLISVVKVLEFTGTPFVQRELVLIKIKAKQESKAEILRLVDIFRSRIIDVSPECYTIEVTGSEDKIIALLDLLRPFGIKEIARTGAIALAREKK